MIGFGEFGKKRERRILDKDDERLIFINPTEEGFFDNVLNFDTKNIEIRKFIEAVQEVKEAEIRPFRKPIYDPSIDNNDTVIFDAGMNPATERSFDFWTQVVAKMPHVLDENQNELRWNIGSEYQYYAFLVYLVNDLVYNCYGVERAVEAVVLDSSALGNYANKEYGIPRKFEKTGSNPVGIICDLANTYKLLKCTNEQVAGFWIASGCFKDSSNLSTLANLSHDSAVNTGIGCSVGWLVLE